MSRQSEINAIVRRIWSTCSSCGRPVKDNHHKKGDQSRHGQNVCKSCHKYKENRGK
jgi:hypothetical protein